jgi:putative ABC transport system permease protein
MLTDLRTAVRALRRQPGFTAAAVLTLALGIGANVALFGIVRAVLLGPLPLSEADRIVTVTERRGSSNDADLPVSAHEFVAWQERNRSFDHLALYHPGVMNLTGVDEPESVAVLRVSADYFPLLGLTAARGRVYAPGEDRAEPEPVAVLSDPFWRRRFGADAGVIGRAITLDDRPFTVIGIVRRLPPSLAPDVWLPLDVVAEARAVGRHNLSVFGRLAPGVTLAQAQTDLNAIASRLEAERPAENTDHRVHLARLRESLVGQFRRPLQLLIIAVGFVLLIACANVANLLLVRTAKRYREIAVRTALGAGRWRIVRQLLVESLTLALFGGVAGVLVALWAVDVASRMTAVRIPLLETAHLDWQAFAVAAAATMFAGVAAGIAPALRWSRVAHGALREQTRATDGRGGRIRATLIAGEVALTLMLLVGTGLLVNSFVRLTRVDAGFSTRGLTVVPIDLPASRYPEAYQRRAFADALIARLQATSGIRSAGAVSHLPLGGADNWMQFQIEGRPPAPPGQEPNAPFRVATPGYFQTMGIPLQDGRLFTDADARRAVPLVRWYPQQPYPPDFDRPQPPPVAVISMAAARQFWPGEDPVGKRIRVLFSPTITIVGVVGDVRHNALDLPAYPHIYLAHNQEPWASLSVVVRASDDRRIAGVVRERVRALDAALPITIRTMADVRAASIGRPRFFMLLVGLFGAVALALALVGILGVVSYVVAERTREIGVRVALGAQRREILALIVAQGMQPIAAGLVAGTAGALVLTRFIASLLYGIEPTDPLTFVSVVALLGITALLACLFPARRAARMDPVIALRVDA